MSSHARLTTKTTLLLTKSLLFMLGLYSFNSFASGVHFQKLFEPLSALDIGDVDGDYVGLSANNDWMVFRSGSSYYLTNKNGDIKEFSTVALADSGSSTSIQLQQVDGAQNNLVFVDSYAHQSNNGGAPLHLYSIENESFSSYYVPIPDSVSYVSRFDVLATDAAVFYVGINNSFIDDVLYKLDLTTETWQQLSLSSMFTCDNSAPKINKLVASDHNGNLIVEIKCNQQQSTIWQLTEENSSTKLFTLPESAELLVGGSGLTSIAFKHNLQVSVYDLAEQSWNTVSAGLDWFYPENTEMVSPDGRYLVASFNPAVITNALDGRNNERGTYTYKNRKAGRVVYDRLNVETAIISGELQYLENQWQAQAYELLTFSSNDELLVETKLFNNQQKELTGIDKISLESVFNSAAPLSEIEGLSANSSTPFQVRLSYQYDDSFISMKRTHIDTDETLSFIIPGKGTGFTDHQYGLEPGEYRYALSPCDKNLRCDFTQTVGITTTVSDFNAVPELTYGYPDIIEGPLGDPYSEYPRYFDISVSDGAAGDVQVITAINEVGQQLPAVFTGYWPSHVISSSFVARNCAINKLTYSYQRPYDSGEAYLFNLQSCSQQFSEPVHVHFPYSHNLQVAPNGDLSGVNVTWERLPGFTYRITGTGDVVLENTELSSLNVELDAGQYHQYALSACNGDLCITEYSDSTLLSHINQTSSVKVEHRSISVQSSYYFDNFRVFRKASWSEENFAQIGSFDSVDDIFEDNEAQVGAYYDYEILGCFQDNCTVLDQKLAHLIPTEINDPYGLQLPPQLDSFNHQPLLLGVRLEWQGSGDYHGVQIQQQLEGEWQTIALVENHDTTTLDIPYFLTPYSQYYRARSFRRADYDNNEEQSFYFSAAKLVEVTPFDPLAGAPESHIAFTTHQTSGSTFRFQWQEWPGIDTYHIFKRGENEETFQKIHTWHSNGINFGYDKIDYDEPPPPAEALVVLDEELGLHEAVTFYIQGCSSYTKSCASNPIAKTIYSTTSANAIAQFLTTAPEIRVDDSHVLVIPSVPEHEDVKSYLLYNAGGQFITESENPILQVPLTSLTAGTTYGWKTQYCFSNQYCSPLSAVGTITLPDRITGIPGPNLLDWQFENDRGNLYLLLDFDDDPSLPHFGLFRATEAGALDHLHYTREDDGDFELRVGMLQSDETYEIYARNCNPRQCSEMEHALSIYVPDLTREKPTLTLLSTDPINSSVLVSINSSLLEGFLQYAISDSEVTSAEGLAFQTVSGGQDVIITEAPGTTHYMVSRHCIVEGYCTQLSDTLIITIPEAGAQIGGNINGALEQLRNNEIPEINASIRNWNGYYIQSQTLETTDLHYLANGFTLEFDLDFTFYCWGTINQLVTHGDNGFEVFSIERSSQPDEPGDCTYADISFHSPLWEEHIPLGNTSLDFVRLTFEVNINGTVNLYINGALHSQSDAALDLSFFAFGKLFTNFPNKQILNYKLDKPYSFIPASIDNIIEQPLVSDTYSHPEGISVVQSGLNVSEFKLWDGEIEGETWCPSYPYSQPALMDNLSPVVVNNQQQLSLAEHLSNNFNSAVTTDSSCYFLQYCIDGYCPGYQFLDFLRPEYEALTSWTPVNVEQLEPELFSFNFQYFEEEVPRLFTTDVNQFAQSFNIIQVSTVDSEETVIASFTASELSANWDGQLSHQFEQSVSADGEIQFYLQACNPINCVNTALSEAFVTGDPDSDGDGIPDSEDVFPNDPTESSDFDGDGIGDNSDPDIDNDGVANEVDAFPMDASEWLDTDNDGIGNNSDPDADGDGVLNEDDAFPTDATEWQDTDNDGIGDNSDPDIDGDSIANEDDPTPTVFTDPNDTDGDGLVDAFELRLGTSPSEFNDWNADADRDGFSDILELFAATDIDNASQTPASESYFESFESGPATLMNLNNADKLSTVGASHGSQSYWATSVTSGHVRDVQIEYHGHLSTGYIMFTTYTETADPYFDLELDVNGRTIHFDWDQEQYKMQLSDNTTLYFIRAAHGVESTTRVKFNLRISEQTGFDGFYFPGGGVCRLKGNMPLNPDFNCDGKAELVTTISTQPDHYSYKNTITDINSGGEAVEGTINLLLTHGDFDGDGIIEPAGRGADLHWHIQYSGFDKSDKPRFGLEMNDIPVPADYDGDKITDIAVRRPRTGMWYILRSSDNEIERIKFGRHADDIPVPADYDGDGKTDIAIRRDSNKHWYIRNSSDGQIQRIHFGKQEGDIAVPADYDGDGKADIAIRRPGLFQWIVKRSSDGQIQKTTFGRRVNDIPVPADYDGDGIIDFAVRRVEDNKWHILRSTDNQIQSHLYGFGRYDIPLAAPVMLRWQMALGNYQFIDGAE